MVGGLGRRYGSFVSERSGVLIVVLVLLTGVMAVGAAIGDVDDAGIGEFEVDAPATDALDEIEATYGLEESVVTQVVIRDPSGNVLDRDGLLAGLEWQYQLEQSPEIAETLTDGVAIQGFENLVATAAYHDRYGHDVDPPNLDEQRTALTDLSDAEVQTYVTALLSGERTVDGVDVTSFVPTDVDRDTGVADARLIAIEHEGDTEAAIERAHTVQLAIDDSHREWFDDGFVFGQGVVDAASSSAIGDSFIVITPVALILAVGLLWIAYRDPIDLLIAIGGIAIALVWMSGIMGWLEIPMSQVLIAVPFLLIGLSIDYSLHVVMRYREARSGRLDAPDESTGWSRTRVAMAVGLGGVIVALAAATVSTGVGFLSNVASPLPAVQDFALLAGLGIFATFVVFGALVPAIKVEVDERRTRPPDRTAFGVGGGIVTRLLSGIGTVAHRAPIVILVIALLIGTAGAAGATGIDTEFNQADFLPEDAPEWAKALPGPLAAGTYTVADDNAYLAERFGGAGDDSQAQILISDGVTDPAVLSSMASFTSPGSSIVTDGQGAVSARSPLSVIQQLSERDERVAEAVDERDTTGDALPDTDLQGLYELLFEVDPELASQVIHLDADGTVDSLRLIIDVRGDAGAQTIASDVGALATQLEASTGVTATATGDPLITAAVQDALLDTLVLAFVITVAFVLAFLTALYYHRHGAIELGAITLAPVVISLAALLGSMYALGIPYNSETAVITGLAIGLGVDYSIHLSERIMAELERQPDIERAVQASLTGTGGALLGSAATTAAGFGVLALALVPSLQRFGLVTATAIGLAFIACLTILPALFILRDRLRS